MEILLVIIKTLQKDVSVTMEVQMKVFMTNMNVNTMLFKMEYVHAI
jgi:hypothetical protein